MYGLRRMAEGRRRDFLERYLLEVIQRSFPILPYDEAAAAWHGAERARLEAIGRTPLLADGEIAAVAYVNNLILVTANPRDFSAFAHLRVENWATPRR